MKIIPLIIALLIANITQARIGDTHKELVERFGAPNKVTKESLSAVWAFEDFGYMVIFSESGKSITEMIFSFDTKKLTQTQITKFLLANGKEWRKLKEGSTDGETWQSFQFKLSFNASYYTDSSEKLLALENTISDTWTIVNKEGFTSMRNTVKAQDEANAVDF